MSFHIILKSFSHFGVEYRFENIKVCRTHPVFKSQKILEKYRLLTYLDLSIKMWPLVKINEISVKRQLYRISKQIVVVPNVSTTPWILVTFSKLRRKITP